MRDRARGIDPRPLELASEAVSISHEETFPQDIADRERLHDELRRMAARLAEHLAKQGLTARTVSTKVRYPDFQIRSRSFSLPVGTPTGSGSASSPAASSTARSATGPERSASSA